MFFVLMTMILDGSAAPAGLLSLSVVANGTNMWLKGSFEPGDTIPMLVWPRNGAWKNPCRTATDLCCMRELLLDYRNDEVQRQQGPRCLTGLKGNLISGSRPDVKMHGDRNFSAVIPLDTPFVTMLFVHVSPFYVIEAVQTFKILPGGAIDVNAIWQNNPCYQVDVPGKLFKVCMHCNNVLRENSMFVWTPTWYTDYVCDWRCKDGFETLDQQCVPLTKTSVPLMPLAIGISAFVVLVLGACFCCQRNQAPSEPDTPTPLNAKAEVIQFREMSITPMQIRVKIN